MILSPERLQNAALNSRESYMILLNNVKQWYRRGRRADRLSARGVFEPGDQARTATRWDTASGKWQAT